jgi:hypothetical protein
VDIQGTSYTADLPINRHTERNRGRCMAARRDGEPANHPSFRNAAIEAQGSAVDALNMAAQGDERHHGTPLAVMRDDQTALSTFGHHLSQSSH